MSGPSAVLSALTGLFWLFGLFVRTNLIAVGVVWLVVDVGMICIIRSLRLDGGRSVLIFVST